MTFADLQRELGLWKKTKHRDIDPVKARKIHLCLKCADKGFKVKMDYIHNRHEKANYTMYNVDYYKCPRCLQIYEQRVRIEGRGKNGFNAGKELGSG